jgi:hypothetical protein
LQKNSSPTTSSKWSLSNILLCYTVRHCLSLPMIELLYIIKVHSSLKKGWHIFVISSLPLFFNCCSLDWGLLCCVTSCSPEGGYVHLLNASFDSIVLWVDTNCAYANLKFFKSNQEKKSLGLNIGFSAPDFFRYFLQLLLPLVTVGGTGTNQLVHRICFPLVYACGEKGHCSRTKYTETSIYCSRIIRFPGYVVQFLWPLGESYFNYGSRIYCFPGSIVSLSDPRRKRWIEVSLYLWKFLTGKRSDTQRGKW